MGDCGRRRCARPGDDAADTGLAFVFRPSTAVLGTAKQAVGSGITGVGLDGSAWTADGKEQHAKGEAEIKAAQ